MVNIFKKATRKKVKLKIAITGPTGSGKTYSALLLAKGMGQRIALIDTENSSSELYEGKDDLPDFDTFCIDPPFTTEKLSAAIQNAVDNNYDVLIIDSLSMFWAGDGGLLAQKEALDIRGGNQYTNWASITKKYEAFKSDIVNSKIHTICTIRSKQDYMMATSDNGKSKPIKVGLAPIQREGIDYEFTIVFDLAMDHTFAVQKDRTGLFDGIIEKINSKTAEKIMDWLNKAKEIDLITQEQKETIEYGIAKLEVKKDIIEKWLAKEKVTCINELSREYADKIINALKEKLNE